VWVLCAVSAVAGPVPEGVLADMAHADVVIVGEVHDNPGHHVRQAEVVRMLSPFAVVWEMLTPEAATGIAGMDVSQADALEKALDWGASGWPSFEMYSPVFAAGSGARHFGGQVPRKAAFSVARDGLEASFGAGAAAYGLTTGLPMASQAAREADQQDAHCGAMPVDKLPLLVDIQRLRDAVLARQVVAALDQVGGPVVVITGNGHARRDRGIVIYLARVRPELRVFVLGQSEAGQITGSYDAVLDSPAVDRPDPCLAFQKAD
jgi:uncharacterized iron-regulated protein